MMVFEFDTPEYCKEDVLDDYLSQGWFRDGSLMSRYEMIYFRDYVYSVVPLRIDLEKSELSKSQKKLLRKNKNFRVEIKPMEISEEKEAMYQIHKERFKSPNSPANLHRYFKEEGSVESPFETWELNIWDNDKLASVSFFDVGKDVLCSILALFDPGYEKNSLGFMTMLLEVNYAKEKGYKYFYPGYVLDEPSVFDYKTRLSGLEYFDWKGYWKPYEKFQASKSNNAIIRKRLNEVKNLIEGDDFLDLKLIQNEGFFYNVWHRTFDLSGVIPSPLYLQFDSQWGHHLVIEYLLEEDEYLFTLGHYQKFIIQCTDVNDLKTAFFNTIKILRGRAIIQQQRIKELKTYLESMPIPLSPMTLFSNGQKMDGFVELGIEGKYLNFYISFDVSENVYVLQASNSFREISIDTFEDLEDLTDTLFKWMNKRNLFSV